VHESAFGTKRTCRPLQIKLLKNGALKIYPGYPHGMLTTHADIINPDTSSPSSRANRQRSRR
jgi:hypothetical protein